ncbi:hypothetical protein HTY54_04470 [Escherichia coli]|nr:hypothetical protein [Escherichia coli]
MLRRTIRAICEGRDPGNLTTIDDPASLDQIRQGDGRVGRIRRSRRIRHRAQMPDATLTRLIMPTGLNRRSDKALAPHPTPCADA